MCCTLGFVFFKQKTAYEMRISDWSSDVCSSDLVAVLGQFGRQPCRRAERIEQLDDRRRVEALFLIVTGAARNVVGAKREAQFGGEEDHAAILPSCRAACASRWRSEEHTSELQSLMRTSYAVFCLNKKTTPED